MLPYSWEVVIDFTGEGRQKVVALDSGGVQNLRSIGDSDRSCCGLGKSLIVAVGS